MECIDIWSNTRFDGADPFLRQEKALVSAALAFVTYMIAFSMQGIQSPMIKMFSNNEWRGFFILAMLMHLGIVLVLTAVAYFVGYIKQKRRSKFSRT